MITGCLRRGLVSSPPSSFSLFPRSLFSFLIPRPCNSHPPDDKLRIIEKVVIRFPSSLSCFFFSPPFSMLYAGSTNGELTDNKRASQRIIDSPLLLPPPPLFFFWPPPFFLSLAKNLEANVTQARGTELPTSPFSLSFFFFLF